jgi:beta-phosphoglucomutase-like phosphatase (HAD superfamily)
MFLKAMEIKQLSPSETLIFEDSETGLQAASRANPGRVIIVNSNNMDYADWPYLQINSFDAVDPGWFNLSH